MTSNRIVHWLKPLTSLKLTIFCLACAMVLIFVGTLDQVHIGIYEAQNRYFKSFFLFFTPPRTTLQIPWFPGGYIIGGLLLANLIAAHVSRFKLSWKKAGILLVHSGLILLLLGQLLTGLFQVESQLRLNQGEAKNYSESFYHDELALIDTSAPDTDQIISIPDSKLARGNKIDLSLDSLQLVVNEFYPNSVLINPSQLPSPNYPHFPIGPMAVSARVEKTYKQDERNMPSANVSLIRKGESVGTWSVASGFPRPVSFELNGKSYQLVMRAKRFYKPFSIQLLQFSHDRYAGTDIAKNFSSRVRISNPTDSEGRETLIFMNNPLRYRGLTFYQAGFDNNDNTSILQVVKNPSWLVPYISCGVIIFGLLVQFTTHLVSFVRRRVIA